MTLLSKPSIGIILDWEEKGTFSSFPYYALRTHYIDAIRAAGGTPWLIPYGEGELAKDYLNKIDGLLVPGGFYATPDEWYPDKENKSPYQETPRFKFEKIIITEALEKDIPILGICAGMQVIGGLLGCKLTGDIEKHTQGQIAHFDLKQDHQITIVKDSLLHKIIGTDRMLTNSHHREAIISTSDKVDIIARSDDGAIEAIAVKNKKFALGLQWHPEMLYPAKTNLKQYSPQQLIFQEFIKQSH